MKPSPYHLLVYCTATDLLTIYWFTLRETEKEELTIYWFTLRETEKEREKKVPFDVA